MEKETKKTIKSLIECLAALTEKQGMILTILSHELNLQDEAKENLRLSGEENHRRAAELRRTAESLL